MVKRNGQTTKDWESQRGWYYNEGDLDSVNEFLSNLLTLEQPYANKSESSEIAKSASLVSMRLAIWASASYGETTYSIPLSLQTFRSKFYNIQKKSFGNLSRNLI